MSSNTPLEQRMAAVEATIAELQQQMATPQPTNWLQQITGSFKDAASNFSDSTKRLDTIGVQRDC